MTTFLTYTGAKQYTTTYGVVHWVIHTVSKTDSCLLRDSENVSSPVHLRLPSTHSER